MRLRSGEEAGASLGIVEVMLRPEFGDQELRQRRRFTHQLLESLLAVLADVAVRIVFLGQEKETDRLGVGRKRQADLQRTPGSLAPGIVAVVREHQFVGEAQQLGNMRRRGRRAQGRHRVADAELRERHHVHVALYHQHAAGGTHRIARLHQAVDLAAFFEQRRFRRVQVFRRVLYLHYTAAKTDHRAAGVQDREHDAVAEAVVALALVRDHQPRLHQRLVLVVGKRAFQALPVVRREADPETGGDLAGQPAPFQVVDGARRLLQLGAVELHRGFHHGPEAGFLLFALGFTLRLLVRARLRLGHLHADHGGEVLHRIDIAHATVGHQKADGIAVRAAAEAVIELLRGADGERG